MVGAENTGKSNKLADKVAVISGAGTTGGKGVGNGAATAIAFARHGAKLVLVDIETEWVTNTEDKVKDLTECLVIGADVTKTNECAKVVKDTIESFGKLDILHNNVGGGPKNNVMKVGIDDWLKSIDLNLMSAVNMSRHAIPEMIGSGDASIVNTSSISAIRPGKNFTPYVTTNMGLVGLTKSMAIDHAKENIRVNCIMPGPIWTPKIAQSRSKEERERRNESVPLPKEGNPFDVADAAAFLASEEAAWITGSVLPVDGGVLLTRKGNREDMF